MNILIIIYLILFFVLSWRRLDWSVFLILAILPSYLIRFKILGIPFTLLEAMILISFAVLFVKNYKKILDNLKLKINSKLIRYPFDSELVLVLIVSFVAVGIAGFSDGALGIWKAYFFEPLLFYILLINIIKNSNIVNSSFEFPERDSSAMFHSGRNDNIGKIIWPLAVSALGVSLVAIYQYITGDLIFNEFWANAENRRAVSIFGYPNAVGLYLAPIVMLMIGYFSFVILRSKTEGSLKNNRRVKKQRLFAIAQNDKISLFFTSVIILLLVLSIYFAKSEGALVGLVAGLFVFGILSNKKTRWLTIVFVIIFSIGIFAYQPIRIKALDKITFMDLSGQIRKAQWKETWEMLKDGRLIIGSGLDNYQKIIKPYHAEGIFIRDPHDPDWHKKTVFNKKFRDSVWQPLEIYMYPHNIFLNFWTELGLAGLFLFVWIIGKFLFIGIRNLKIGGKNRYLVLGLICSMIVIVVHGLVDVPYFKNDLAIFFWILIAMMSVLNLELKDN